MQGKIQKFEDVQKGDSIQMLQLQSKQLESKDLIDQYDFQINLSSNDFLYIPLIRTKYSELKQQLCPIDKPCQQHRDCYKSKDEQCINGFCHVLKWCNKDSKVKVTEYKQHLNNFIIMIKSQLDFQKYDIYYNNIFTKYMNLNKKNPNRSFFNLTELLTLNQNYLKSDLMRQGGILNFHLYYSCYFYQFSCEPDIYVNRVDGKFKKKGYSFNHTKYYKINQIDYKDSYIETGIKLNFICEGEYNYVSVFHLMKIIALAFSFLYFPFYFQDFIIFFLISRLEYFRDQKYFSSKKFVLNVQKKKKNLSNSQSIELSQSGSESDEIVMKETPRNNMLKNNLIKDKGRKSDQFNLKTQLNQQKNQAPKQQKTQIITTQKENENVPKKLEDQITPKNNIQIESSSKQQDIKQKYSKITQKNTLIEQQKDSQISVKSQNQVQQQPIKTLRNQTEIKKTTISTPKQK